MSFHFIRSFQPKSILGFSLNQLVNKISWFLCPTLWNVFIPYFCLHFQYLISYLFTGSTFVWSSAHHELETANTNCEIVNSDSMVLAAHYFRCHIARGTACIRCVIWPSMASNSKISQMYVSPRIKNEVLWFNVSMKHSILVKEF